jgi:hypothetical protein
MAFSGSSYFFGIGTAFAAIAVGFAGGAMITTSTVQPPNRLERVAVGAVVPSEQANTTKPAPQNTPPSPVVAAAPPAPAADPQPAAPPQPTPPAAANTTTNVQERAAPAAAAKNAAPTPVARGDDTAPAKSERTTVGRAPDPSRDVSRSVDPNKDIARKRADERKPDDRRFSDRRRRQDQDERRLDEATNVVRQMPRGEVVDEIRARPRRFEVFEDDDAPRALNGPPPRFGVFGD